MVAVGNAEAAARPSDDLTHLHTAMMSRACIEQAKGILMGRHKIKEDEAFTILTHASQQTNTNSAPSPKSSSGPARCPVDTKLPNPCARHPER
jgi:ANTAR domain